jgi:EAL domain-containing protein (putative c-di-GMP-specific phosphodiesterase class I)
MRPAELSNDPKRTESGLPPRRRELEVTESIFLDGGDHIQAMLKNLRTLGIRMTISAPAIRR